MTDRGKLFNLLDSAIAESKKSCKEQGECKSCRYIEFGAKCQEMAQVDYLIANGVNLASVVHGRWINEMHGNSLNGTCSVCGYYDHAYAFSWKHCPDCGAKMDGGVSDG